LEEDILLKKIAAQMTSDPDMIARIQAMMLKLNPEVAQAANTTAPATKNKDGYNTQASIVQAWDRLWTAARQGTTIGTTNTQSNMKSTTGIIH
jgi:hypothetical protein